MSDLTVSFSSGGTLTDRLVKLGAPRPEGSMIYRLSIAHDPGGPSEVTAMLGEWYEDEWMEQSRYTERTRVSLDMAAVAAATHAYEDWKY